MNTDQSLRSKIRNGLVRFGISAIKKLEYLIVRYSPDGNREFFDPAKFPWAAELEKNWMVMRRELDRILIHRETLPTFQDISKDQITISNDQNWKVFFLYGYGYKSEQNCQLCPESTRLVEQVPGMLTAFFSILGPGKHIPSHRGPYKGVLRYHLGLKVPEPREKCRIRVNQEIRHWEEGRSLIFDDSFYHEVWNDTPGERVVLFLDVIRPLRFPLSLINRLIIRLVALSPYVQDARKNQYSWEKLMETVINTPGTAERDRSVVPHERAENRQVLQ